MLIAFNTVQLLQCKTPIFLSFWTMASKRVAVEKGDGEGAGAVVGQKCLMSSSGDDG